MLSDPSKTGKADLDIKNTGISLNDLLYFKPDLGNKPIFKALASKLVDFSTDIRLRDSMLTITDFYIGQDKAFGITANGKAFNAFQSEKLRGNLQFDVPDINSAWLKEAATKIGIEKELPDIGNLSFNGIVSDSLNITKFKILLKSDLGNIDLLGNLDLNNKSYSANSIFDNLMIGRLTGNQSLGSFDGSISLDGKGLNLNTLQANAFIKADSLFFNNYTYTAASVEVKVDNELINIRLKIDDPGVKTDLKSTFSFKDSKLDLTANGTFHADLLKLHVLKDTLSIGGRLSGNFQKKENDISSRLGISDLLLTANGDSSKLNRLDLFFTADSVKSNINCIADFFNLSLSVARPVNEFNSVFSGFQKYTRSFLDPDPEASAKRTTFLAEMNGKMQIKYDRFLALAIRDTSIHFSELNFSLVSSPGDKSVNLKIDGSNISYKVAKIGNIAAGLTDSGGVLNLSLDAAKCHILSRPANNIILTASLAGGKGLTKATFTGGENELLYDIELGESIDTANIIIEIPSKQVVLNGVKWTLESPGLFSYNIPGKTISPALQMHTNNSTVRILTQDSDSSHTYKADLENVAFNSLVRTDMIEGKPEGTISGTLEYGIKGKQGKKVASEINLTDVKWHGLEYNNISMKGSLDSDSPNDYRVELTGRLDTAGIFIKGMKHSNGNPNLKAEFNSIPISTFQPFVDKFLTDLKGYVSGKFDFISNEGSGTITGDVFIKDVNMRINTLNSLYRIPDERIKFLNKRVIFDNFSVLDSLNNKLSVDGYLDYSNGGSILADLNVKSSNLQVMNRNEEINSSFYGDIFINSNLSITGPVSGPVMKGKIALTAGTEIFFRQLENLNLSESSKILTFKSRNQPVEDIKIKPVLPKTVYNKPSIESIVVIDPSTRLNIGLAERMYKIDLSIQGGGDLNYNMLSNSQVNIAGKYIVSAGSADLKMIGWPNKAFTITKGGFIYWSGKMDDPELKFEAVNKVKSSYVNPVDNKERYVDFDVNLKISNRLSDMSVLFSISTPDQYLMSIINTLSPEEQMRQAITILLFKQIDLPGISTSSNYVTEQVNQMVETQLNQLTKTTIKGIDISFGIDSYVQATESGGQETKTSLSYQVKRSLMNNRAQFELSGRINDVNKQPNASDMSLNNFSFEYRLDSAATKFLKVYNEHSYEDVFEGEVLKTGIGFTYRKSYPSLGDIWRKDEERLKKPEQNK